MEEADVKSALIVLAVVTPVLAAVLYFTLRKSEAAVRGDVEVADGARRMRNRLILLALAGPLNLGCWLLFNRVLEKTGYRSVAGYVLAAAIFLGGGLLTGTFSNRFGRGRK